MPTNFESFVTTAYMLNQKGETENDRALGYHLVGGLVRDFKIFEIDDASKKLLLLTDPPDVLSPGELILPFNEMFLDVSFTKEEGFPDGTCRGLVVKRLTVDQALEAAKVSNIDMSQEWAEDIEKTILIIATVEDLEKKEVMLTSYALNDEKKSVGYKFLMKFLTNLQFFLDQPDVEILEVKRSEKNRERRIRQGKFPMPSGVRILIKGTLKKYVNAMKASGHLSQPLGHAYWVRGHWRHFNSAFYKNLRGTRKLVLPYIKGEGMIINRYYKIESK
jgi:hypothetical protein